MKDGSPGEAWAPSDSQPQWRKHLVLVPFSSSAVSTVGRIWAANPCGERQKKSELEVQLLGHFIFLLSFQALYRHIVKEVV